MRVYLEYLKIQYKHLDSDCYALVRLFYKQELGIALPEIIYDEDWAVKGENLIFRNFTCFGFTETKELDFTYGNIIVMGDAKIPKHLGISLADGTFLHTRIGGTVRTRYKDSAWTSKIITTLKHEETV